MIDKEPNDRKTSTGTGIVQSGPAIFIFLVYVGVLRLQVVDDMVAAIVSSLVESGLWVKSQVSKQA
jgi:hypothetical protein